MIVGVGVILLEYYGLNLYVGRIGMVIVFLIIVLLGLIRFFKILGNIGFIIIIFIFLVGVISLFSNIDVLLNVGNMVDSLNIKIVILNGYFLGVFYICYNVIIVIIFLIGMGVFVVNKKDVVWGGIVGGVVFMVVVIMMNLVLFLDIGNIYIKEILVFYLVDKIFLIIGILFLVVFLLGIYIIVVLLLWLVINWFVEDDYFKFKIIIIVVSILVCIGGLLLFDKLVGILYLYIGYMGILILLCMFYRRIIKIEGYKENKFEIS